MKLTPEEFIKLVKESPETCDISIPIKSGNKWAGWDYIPVDKDDFLDKIESYIDNYIYFTHDFEHDDFWIHTPKHEDDIIKSHQGE